MRPPSTFNPLRGERATYLIRAKSLRAKLSHCRRATSAHPTVVPDTKRNAAANALRRGRFSAPHANYFVTICVEPRVPVRVDEIANGVLHEAQLMANDGLWKLRCLSSMPDHVHLLFTLGERLTLSQSIGRLKSKTRSAFRIKNTDWQDNFYDHCFRPADSIEATIRYIHQNPHQAGLISSTGKWPHFYCCAEDWSWFEKLTDSGQPFPEWLV